MTDARKAASNAEVAKEVFGSEGVRLQATLLTCPFCGGEGVGFESSSFNGLGFVRCVTCWASGPETESLQTSHDAWNRRAPRCSDVEFRCEGHDERPQSDPAAGGAE